jgi:hypothetical protein
MNVRRLSLHDLAFCRCYYVWKAAMITVRNNNKIVHLLGFQLLAYRVQVSNTTHTAFDLLFSNSS